MERLFKAIVAGSTVLFVIFWLLPFIDSLWLTDPEIRLLRADSLGSVIPNSPFIYWGMFSLWLLLSVGLFLYVRAARTGFLVMLILVSVANLFWGFRVFSPLGITLSYIITLCDGAIVTMAYLTSINEKFSKRSRIGRSEIRGWH